MDLDHLTLSIDCSLTRLGLDGPPIHAAQQHTSESETTAHNRLVEEIATALGDHSEFGVNSSLIVEPQEVVHSKEESGERGKVVEAGVRAMPVVVVKPG